MTHYEERLARDVERIRQRITAIGTRVQQALADAVHAFATGNHELASATILGDLPINREVRESDRLCHAFVARHLPSAGHLRLVSSVLRLNIELERVGDYAVSIARETVQLSRPPDRTIGRDVELLYEHAGRFLRQALKAFLEGNAELARGAMGTAGSTDATFRAVFTDLLRLGEKGETPQRDLFALLLICHRLQRVSDQAKNMCEETLFAVAGETKPAKRYRLLFLDAKNSSLSKMAEVYASRAFPDSGVYDSRGWQPAAGLESRFVGFMGDRGFELSDHHPLLFEPVFEELAEYDVIVGLEAGARDQIDRLPYHTVFLQWDLGPPPDDYDQERAQALLDESYRKLVVKLSDLIELLRGEGAG